MTNYAALDPIKYAVCERIHAAMCQTFPDMAPPELGQLFTTLEQPPDPTLGDYAFPCFRLAKALRQNPAALAQQLAQSLAGHAPITTTSTAAAFLNITVDKAQMGRSLLTDVDSGRFFGRLKLAHASAKRKIMVEHSQPNTHKEFHIGHVRNVSLGDALVRLFRYQGDEVIAANYPGDEGTHIAKCLWQINRVAAQAPATGRGTWLGKMYEDATRALADATADEKKKYQQEVGGVLSEIESKQGPMFDQWCETRQWSLDAFYEIYDFLDVHFDIYFFESELSEESQQIVDEYLAKQVFVLSEGAIGCDLSEDKLGFMLVRKRDGNTLYATKDLVLARRKFNEFEIETSIYVVGSEQNLHFRQVFKTLEKMGFEQAKRCFHLSYGHVRLPEGKMSSRDGTAVSFANMRQAIEAELDQTFAAHPQEWTAEERAETRRKLCVAAIKYGMLSSDPAKDIVYRAADWVAFEGDTGPYLLYSYARTQSLLRKAEAAGLRYETTGVEVTKFEHDAELQLIRSVYDFNDAVWRACDQLKPSLLAHQLYDMCKSFNRLYNQVPILKCEDLVLVHSRLRLIRAFATVLARGLNLIGIETVDKM